MSTKTLAYVEIIAASIGEIFYPGNPISTKLYVMAALTLAADALAPDAPQPQKSALKGIIRSTVAAHQLVYGEVKTGGVLIFSDTYGANNEYLCVGIAHSITGPNGIQSLGDAYVDNVRIASSAIDGSGNVTSGQFSGVCTIDSYLGTSSQAADSILTANFSTYWKSTAQLKGISYSVFRYYRNPDDTVFQTAFKNGIPQDVARIVRGQKVYDPRLDSTSGGTGAQRKNDSSTWTWSTNPALCLRDFLTRAKLDGGCGYDPSSVLDADLSAAANICDESITIPTDGVGGSTTIARYSCNMAILTGGSNDDEWRNTAISNLLACMAGNLIEQGGKFRIYAGAYVSADAAIDATWLRGGAQTTVTAQRDDRWNAVRATFEDPFSDYQTIQCAAQTSSAYQTADGGVQLWRELNVPGCNNQYQAQYLSRIALNTSRHQRAVSLACNLKALQLEPMEGVTLALNDEPGYAGKTFRVTQWLLNADFSVDLGLLEIVSTTWTSALGNFTYVAPPANAPVLAEIPPVPTGLTAVGTADGINLTWSPPAATIYSTIGIWRAPDVSGSPGTFSFLNTVRGGVYQDAVLTGATYWYKIRALNFRTTPSAFTAPVSAKAKTVADGADVTGLNTALDTANVLGVAAPSVISRVNGFQCVQNPDFALGLFSYAVYDNNATGNVAISLVADNAAPNSTGTALQIVTSAGAAPSPGLGGFYYPLAKSLAGVLPGKFHPGDRNLVTVVANIPIGYTLNFTNNSLGTGGSATWKTPQAGTGTYQPYTLLVLTGTDADAGGAFPFFYLTGGAAPVTWKVAQLTCTDIDQTPRFGVIAIDDGQRALVDATQAGHVGAWNLDSRVAEGATFNRSRAAGMLGGYIKKVSQDGSTLFPAKGTGDTQKLDLDAEIIEAATPIYRRSGSGYVDASGRHVSVWDDVTGVPRSGGYVGEGARRSQAGLDTSGMLTPGLSPVGRLADDSTYIKFKQSQQTAIFQKPSQGHVVDPKFTSVADFWYNVGTASGGVFTLPAMTAGQGNGPAAPNTDGRGNVVQVSVKPGDTVVTQITCNTPATGTVATYFTALFVDSSGTDLGIYVSALASGTAGITTTSAARMAPANAVGVLWYFIGNSGASGGNNASVSNPIVRINQETLVDGGGARLGDGSNMIATTQAGQNYMLSGCALSDTGTTSKTVSMASGTLYYGTTGSLSLGASSVTGLAPSTKYYCYVDLPSWTGGTYQLVCTTDGTQISRSPMRVFIGWIMTQAAGGGGGGGGPGCLHPSVEVLTRIGFMMADELSVGDELLTPDGQWTPITALTREPCSEWLDVKTEESTARVTLTQPYRMADGNWKRAAALDLGDALAHGLHVLSVTPAMEQSEKIILTIGRPHAFMLTALGPEIHNGTVKP